MQRNKFHLRFIALFFTLFLAFIPNSFAQDQNTENSAPLKQEQLDQLLAPIALYPDSLLTQILMASTYPVEIVEADRWLNENDNKNLTGDDLAKALEAKTWDPSVKSLVNFPQVLDMMNNQLGWTQQLGYAVMAQQQDVLDTVQKLRQKAQKNGKLKTTSQQTVSTDSSNDIIIEPASPTVVYVPIYNPSVVYGPWWWPYYPPYYFYPLGYGVPGNFIAFTAGYILGSSWGYSWGGFDWRHGYMDVNVNRNINYNRNINRNSFNNQHSWKHDPNKPFNRPTTIAKPSHSLSSTGLKGQKTTTESLTKGLKSPKVTQQSISSGLKTKTFAPVNKRPSYETNSMVRPSSVSRLHSSHTAPNYSHTGTNYGHTGMSYSHGTSSYSGVSHMGTASHAGSGHFRSGSSISHFKGKH
ncbi:MAG: DUF3300 domain-containing protein [Gammaproteobacteria bacterium]|nr:DUF3300 domain-containing protein [Gammaproteobacteria bacterium]